MKKVRIGVLGAYRGTSMINYCKNASNAEVVAICDKWKEGLAKQKEKADSEGFTNIAYYDNFDDFIKHDMDAVVLANYATEHAPFAIRAMKAGKHVFSEVTPCQTMKEAVELIEAVEETGKIYAYGENYCYMAAPMEMKKRYRAGEMGNVFYAEGEYSHRGISAASLTYGDPNHWRNNLYSTYYCTHSLGPIIHITGLRPTHVVGFEADFGYNAKKGYRGAMYGVEMVTLENGAVVKSLHGGLLDSIWYSLHCENGRLESERAYMGDYGYVSKISVQKSEMPMGAIRKVDTHMANTEFCEYAKKQAGHYGSDYYVLWHFAEKILGNPEADIIDVYEAMDMFLPGHFAYRSLLKGGVTLEVPNLRNKAERDKWRNDVECTDPKVAGDKVWPCMAKGNPDIPYSVYENLQAQWKKEFESGTGYVQQAFAQGDGTTKLNNNK